MAPEVVYQTNTYKEGTPMANITAPREARDHAYAWHQHYLEHGVPGYGPRHLTRPIEILRGFLRRPPRWATRADLEKSSAIYEEHWFDLEKGVKGGRNEVQEN